MKADRGIDRLTRLLLWASGADLDLVQRPECAAVRGRYAGLGGAVLSTAFFAGVAMAYLLSGVFGSVAGLFLGVVWAIVIFNVDRYLVGSLVCKEEYRALDLWKIAAPRLLLAVLIAASVSEPLLVAIFREEIALQLEKDNVAERTLAEERIEARWRPAMDRLGREEAAIRAELRERDSLVRLAYEAAAGEADGLAGSRIRGHGPRWTDKVDRYRLLLREYEVLEARATVRLQDIGRERERAAALRAAEAGRIDARARAADSFLRQHMALQHLKEDPEVGAVVAWRARLVRALIFALEILPLLAKLMLPRNPYDALYQRIHDGDVRRLDSERRAFEGDLRVRDRGRARIWRAAEELTTRSLARARGSVVWEAEERRLGYRLAPAVGGLVQTSFGGIFASDPRGVARQPRGVVSDPGGGDPHPFRLAPAVGGNGRAEPATDEGAPRPAPGPALVARVTTAAWRTPRRRAATLGGSASLMVLVAAAFPYVGRPCRTDSCPLPRWVASERARTRVLDRSGSLLGTIPAQPPVELDSLPPYVVHLLEAIEDRRFRRHFGVDPVAAVHAAVGNVLHGDDRGASTLSMQTVRCLDRKRAMWPDGGWPGKIAEARLALELEARYGKDDILEMYLGCVDLGWIEGVHVAGVEQAGWTYFGKPARDLSLAEAATLVGMIQGPQLYHPVLRPRNARLRRDHVLRRLSEVRPPYGAAVERALREPLATLPREKVPRPPAALALVAERLGGAAPPEVTTTLEGDLQRAIEGELGALLGDVEGGRYGAYTPTADNPLIAGAIVMESASGSMRGYVCGRPLGLGIEWVPCRDGEVALSSVLKLFLVLAALDAAVVDRDDTLGDLEARAGLVRRPDPYVRRVCAESRDRRAWTVDRLFLESDNCLALLLHRLLPPEAFARLRAIGVAVDPAQPTSALGTGTIPLLRLTRLVAGIANGGVVPRWEILDDPLAPDTLAAERLPFRPSTLAAVRELMAAVVDGGTGSGARSALPESVAGFAKTGTSNHNEELLVAGFAEGLVTVAWVGHQGNRRPIHEHAMASRILAPHWGRIVSVAVEIARAGPE